MKGHPLLLYLEQHVWWYLAKYFPENIMGFILFVSFSHYYFTLRFWGVLLLSKPVLERKLLFPLQETHFHMFFLSLCALYHCSSVLLLVWYFFDYVICRNKRSKLSRQITQTAAICCDDLDTLRRVMLGSSSLFLLVCFRTYFSDLISIIALHSK